MNRPNLFSNFFAGYTDFSGRCTRATYWKTVPVWVLVFVGITFLSLELTGAPRQILFWGFVVTTTVPVFALTIKRLHDFNASGYFSLGLVAVGVLGGIWFIFLGFIIIGCVPPTRGINQYGDDARGGNASVFD